MRICRKLIRVWKPAVLISCLTLVIVNILQRQQWCCNAGSEVKGQEKPIDDKSPETDRTRAVFSTENHGSKACQPQHAPYGGEYVRSSYKPPKKFNCAQYTQQIDVVEGRIHYLKPGSSCRGELLRSRTDAHISTVDFGPLKEGQKVPEAFMVVKCADKHKTGLGSAHRNEQLVEKKKKAQKPENMNLNIFMLSFDSVSLAGALYQIPKTMEYIKTQMNAVFLNDYTIVGDGTPQAMLPILTGKTELELPITRRENKENASFVDEVYPLMHFETARNGYLTTFFEKMTKYPMFGYRLKGFKDAPADFYSFPYFSKTETFYDYSCYRDKQEYEYTLDFHRELLRTYPDVPKFFFAHNTITHTYPNYLQHADNYLEGYFKSLNEPEVRNKTVIFFMADHGPRYGELRKTYDGRLEERSPLMAIVYPPWLDEAYPEATQNLRKNGNRLTSPFDINPTLKHLVYGLPRKHETGSVEQREISLFHEIPESRECKDAGIAPHWCRCLQEVTIDPKSGRATKAADAVVAKINLLTEGVRNLCSPLKLDTIKNATVLQPQGDLLRFAGAKDLHGFEYKFDEGPAVHPEDVQLLLTTTPGGALYEVTVQLRVSETQTTVLDIDSGVISIVSKYGDTPHCIMQDFPNLRKFCVCYDKIPKNKEP